MNKPYLVFIMLLFIVFVVGCNPASRLPDSSQEKKIFVSTSTIAKSKTNKIKKEEFRKGVVRIRSDKHEGTGFIVGVYPDEVYIITVVHVVQGDPEPTVEFFENQEVKAKILSAEEAENGLALLLVKDKIPDDIIPLYVDKEANLNLGDTVFTFGFPRGGARWAYDALSYAGQKERHLTFSESDIEEGNSGGPMIKDNKVIGVLTSKLQYAFATSAQNIREFLRGARGGKKVIKDIEKWKFEKWKFEKPTKEMDNRLIMAANSVPSSRACGNYTTPLNKAKQSQDLVTLSQLLKTLERQSDCSLAYLDTLKRELSEMATQKAIVLVERGDLNGAKKWLKHQYTPVTLWSTQALRGNIAAKGKHWKKAAEFYSQALDLIAAPTAIPKAPSTTEIEKVYRLATETQLLAGRLMTQRSGQASGTMRDNIRRIEIMERPIPVQFVFGKTGLTEAGQDSVKKLISFFRHKKPTHITLIGHTDRVGSDLYNCALSKGRALALKDYLVKQGGFDANLITTLGKGKRQPFKLYDPSRYTQDEIDHMNRRIEIVIDRDVSYTNQCL